jgi:hypothetical protein
MTKKIAIIFISLLVLLSIGVYLFVTKKSPVTKAPATQQTYTNPVFGYALNIPAGYEVQSSASQSATSQPIKNDLSCVIRKSDNACILPLDAVFDDTKPSISEFLQSPLEYFKTLSITKTSIGAYEAAMWEKDDNINYLFMNNGLVLRVYFIPKNSEIAKTILNTIKFK